TFTVVIPLPTGQQQILPVAADALPVLPPLRVLIADDVPQNLELLQLNLEKMGHQVITASDGASAVKAYQNHPVDLIIMDEQMPGMNGLEASRAIQQLEHASTGQVVPIIALDASVLDKDRQAARDAGMAGFATKPLNIPALVNEMARLLNRQNTADRKSTRLNSSHVKTS